MKIVIDGTGFVYNDNHLWCWDENTGLSIWTVEDKSYILHENKSLAARRAWEWYKTQSRNNGTYFDSDLEPLNLESYHNSGQYQIVNGWDDEIWIKNTREKRLTLHIFKGDDALDEAIRTVVSLNEEAQCATCGIIDERSQFDFLYKRWYCKQCQDEEVGNE